MQRPPAVPARLHRRIGGSAACGTICCKDYRRWQPMAANEPGDIRGQHAIASSLSPSTRKSTWLHQAESTNGEGSATQAASTPSDDSRGTRTHPQRRQCSRCCAAAAATVAAPSRGCGSCYSRCSAAAPMLHAPGPRQAVPKQQCARGVPAAWPAVAAATWTAQLGHQPAAPPAQAAPAGKQPPPRLVHAARQGIQALAEAAQPQQAAGASPRRPASVPVGHGRCGLT